MKLRKTLFRIHTVLFAALLLLASLAGCSVSVVNEPKDSRPLVVCTIFPQYDFVKTVAGDVLDVEMLLPYGADAHSFGVKDLSASYLEKLHGARLLVAVGGESDEQLLDELKIALSSSDVRYLLLTDLIKNLLNEEATEGMQFGGEEEEEEGGEEIDEHVWTSPRRAAELVRGIGKTLGELFPEYKERFDGKTGEYASRLSELDREFSETLEKKTFDTLIFADRFPFRYLCHDYGIEADAAFAGCSTSIEPSLQALEHLYQKAEKLGLPAILYMEGSDPRYAEQLAERIGGRALMLHSCHMVGEEDVKKGYIGLLEYDLEVLKIALAVKD